MRASARASRAGDLQQPLRRRLDGDDAPILEPDAVAGAQHRRLGEVEQERRARRRP